MGKTLLITGGAGFIGSALVRHLIETTDHVVVNVDCLTYAGNLESLRPLAGEARHHLERVRVQDGAALERLFERYRPDGVIHLAAESHVDRSIGAPAAFLDTNVVGTYTLLEVARRHWEGLPAAEKGRFRFLHVSTDEVFGSLDSAGQFTEESRYRPSSPYSATKAASDHLVRAWHHTYGLPAVITHCSNNFGPRQFPEKLIPFVIIRALGGGPLTVYGDGQQVRDWLYVEDHVRALIRVLDGGRIGESYNIGGGNERRNLEVVEAICGLLEELRPQKPAGVGRYRDLIVHVEDRPGHDRRYALDTEKIRREHGWTPVETFESGLRKTVQWYLDNPAWWRRAGNR